MRNMRAVAMMRVLVRVTVRANMVRNVFVNWSNMFSRLVSRTIAGGWKCRVVRRESFVVSRSVCFVSLATCSREKSFLAPERHRHQARHVKRGASRGDRADYPDKPAERNVCRRSRIPKNFVFGPEPAERNDAADREPAGHESTVRVGLVLLQTAHPAHVLLGVHAMNDTASPEKHQGFE